jgi:hypothetical protein
MTAAIAARAILRMSIVVPLRPGSTVEPPRHAPSNAPPAAALSDPLFGGR